MALILDIRFIADDWEEGKHPRGKGGEHGGQFVKKGEEGPDLPKRGVTVGVRSAQEAGEKGDVEALKELHERYGASSATGKHAQKWLSHLGGSPRPKAEAKPEPKPEPKAEAPAEKPKEAKPVAPKPPEFNMPPEDRATLKEYTGVNGQYANAVARGNSDNLGKPQREIGEKLKTDLDRVFAHAPPSTETATVYRGIPRYVAAQAGLSWQDPQSSVGQTVNDNGWTSTSRSYNKAQAFSDPANPNVKAPKVVMTIKLPPGTRSLDMGKYSSHINATREEETLLDRGGKFEVIGYERAGGVLIFNMQYHPRKDE